VNVAVVAQGYGNPWSEEHLLTRRLAGTLACSAEVDLLLPAGQRSVDRDGAVRILRFPAVPLDPPRREAWRLALLGAAASRYALPSLGRVIGPTEGLPAFGEEELIYSEGGYSPELNEHLRNGEYELVVVVGYHSPGAHWGVASLPDDQRIVVVPAAGNTATLGLAAHNELFERAERILVCTERERGAIADRIGADRSDKIENIGFLIGVNALARTTQPYDWAEGDWVVVMGNWFESSPEPLTEWAEDLQKRHGLSLRIVGVGAERHQLGVVRSVSRLDMWRWVTRARALFDPTPDRLLGRDVLEAMLFGTPVLVPDWGGATREHAELADGGLWYRSKEEFLAVAGALRDRDLWEALSAQSQAYAEQNFADPDRFIKRIAELVLH
jgi:hypothetical protein